MATGLLLMASFLAVGNPQPVEPPVTFIWANSFEAPSLDPGVTTSGTAHMIITNVYEKLVRFKPGTTEIEGILAKDWEISECKTVYTFHLRRGVYFTDGAPFNAEAVRINVERLLTLARGPAVLLAPVIKEVTVIDNYTVDFVLKEPCVVFLYKLAAWFGVNIISPRAIAEHAVEDDPWATGWLHDNMVGTGPFMLQEWIPGERMVLVRNENWWRGEPYFDKLVKLIIPEYMTRRMLLLAGEIHMVEWPEVVDLPILKEIPGVRVEIIETINYHHFRFNFNEPVMRCIYLRTALSWAFPYEEVMIITGPDTVQLQGPMPALIPGHCDELFMFYTDLDKARQYLAKAGFQPGELTLTFAINKHPRGRMWFEVFMANLAKIGVELELVEMIWPVYAAWKECPIKEGVEIFFDDHWGQFPEAANFLYLHFAHHETHTPHAQMGWIHPALNEILIEAKGSIDIERRNELWRKAQHIIVDEVASIFANHWTGFLVMCETVGGFVSTIGWWGVWDFSLMYFRNDG